MGQLLYFYETTDTRGDAVGVAGGDLSGVYPSPKVIQAQGGQIVFNSNGSEKFTGSVPQLLDGGGNKSYDVLTRQIFLSGGGPPVFDGPNGIIRGPGGGSSVDLGNRFLQDGSGGVCIAWDNLNLINLGTGQPSVSWGNGTFALFDGSGTISHSWDSRLLFDSSGTQVVDYNSYFLADASSNNSILWGSRQLSQNGSNIALDWSSSSGLSMPMGLATYNAQTLVGNNKISTVNGIVALPAQIGSLSATTLFTPAASAWYDICVSMVNTTAGTSGTVSCAITYKDVTGNTRTINPAGTLTVGTLGNISQGTFRIVCSSSIQAIQYATTATAFVGSPKYDLNITAIRVN